jgi:hydroxymethylbilane synthase
VTRTLRIGTRGSALAMVQARWVAEALAATGTPTELVTIRTEGDDRPPDTAWGEGAFVRRIEAALLDGSVDVAVHSAKDVPTDEHPALVIAAYPVREDPRDALVSRVRGLTLATLPTGSRVGTDSPRRTAFVLAQRPDLVLHPLHGNVDTRLAKLDRGESDALVLAVAGLARLGRTDRIDEVLPLDRIVAAPGQGALAVQVRADDAGARAAVGRIDDPATRLEVEAERAILNRTGGGCRSPVGVTARALEGTIDVVAAVERDWVPAGGAVIASASVGWVRGAATAETCDALVDRLAARIVSLRGAPRAVVGRPPGLAGPLLAALADAGIDAAHVPAIEVAPAAEEGLAAAVQGVTPGTSIVVTSANAVEPVLAALAHAGIAVADLRWAAVGEATAARVREAGIGGVFVPSRADDTTLAAELPLEPGDDVLLPQADLADEHLATLLRGRGASVRHAVAYRTVEGPERSRARLADVVDDGPIDVLVVTSGSTARGFAALAGAAILDRVLATPVVAAGNRAALAARTAGFTTVLVAPAPDALSIAAFTARALGLVPAHADGALQ